MKDTSPYSHPVFIGCDITSAPDNIVGFYQRMRDACNRAGYPAFLPLDHVGLGDQKSMTDEKAYTLVMEAIVRARLGIFYIGFPSIDMGSMLGRIKTLKTPWIMLYEAEKESELRLRDPKIWWRLPETGEPAGMRRGISVTTPTSHSSFLVPESHDPHILEEIKFRDREDALTRLETRVQEFFKN